MQKSIYLFLKVNICKLYGRYNDLVSENNFPPGRVMTDVFIPIVRPLLITSCFRLLD